MVAPKQRMFMQCTETKKFIAINPDAIGPDRDEDAPIWILVEKEEDATNDPGWIGDDYSMQMIMFCKQEYGSGSFSCYTPESDKQALKEYHEEKERIAQERALELAKDGHKHDVIVVGAGNTGKLGRTLARAAVLLSAQTMPQTVCVLDDDLPEVDLAALAREQNFFKPGKHMFPKQKGFVPNRKQMKAMNRQMSRRSGGRGR